MALKRNETPEERERRLSRQKKYYENRKQRETPEQRATRLNREKEREKRKRQNESFVERTKRLTKLQQNQCNRLANETPEMRKHRLEQLRLNQARRLANETPEMRKIRLERLKINQARRLARETPEAKQQRLERMKLCRLKKLKRRTNNSYSQLSLKDHLSGMISKTNKPRNKRLNTKNLPVSSENAYDTTPNQIYSTSGDREDNTNNVVAFQFVSCEIEPSHEFEEEEVLDEYCKSSVSMSQQTGDEQENDYLNSEEDDMDESVSWKKHIAALGLKPVNHSVL